MLELIAAPQHRKPNKAKCQRSKGEGGRGWWVGWVVRWLVDHLKVRELLV